MPTLISTISDIYSVYAVLCFSFSFLLSPLLRARGRRRRGRSVDPRQTVGKLEQYTSAPDIIPLVAVLPLPKKYRMLLYFRFLFHPWVASCAFDFWQDQEDGPVCFSLLLSSHLFLRSALADVGGEGVRADVLLGLPHLVLQLVYHQHLVRLEAGEPCCVSFGRRTTKTKNGGAGNVNGIG